MKGFQLLIRTFFMALVLTGCGDKGNFFCKEFTHVPELHESTIPVGSHFDKPIYELEYHGTKIAIPTGSYGRLVVSGGPKGPSTLFLRPNEDSRAVISVSTTINYLEWEGFFGEKLIPSWVTEEIPSGKLSEWAFGFSQSGLACLWDSRAQQKGLLANSVRGFGLANASYYQTAQGIVSIESRGKDGRVHISQILSPEPYVETLVIRHVDAPDQQIAFAGEFPDTQVMPLPEHLRELQTCWHQENLCCAFALEGFDEIRSIQDREVYNCESKASGIQRK